MQELEQCLAAAEDVARRVVPLHSEAWDAEARWPEEAMRALQDAGLMGLVVPRAHGGHGQGLYAVLRLCEVLGRADASLGLCFGMHQVGAACISQRARPEQVEAFLGPIAQGRHITTLALSEPGTGSHFYLPQATIERSGEEHVMSGRKSFVTSAGHADSYVISGRSVAPGAPPGHFSLLVLPADTPGVELGAPWSGWGMRGNASRDLALHAARVPASHLLGREGEHTWFVFQVVAPYFLMAMTGTYLGIATRALDEAVRALTERQHAHSGRPLAEIGLLQHRIGQLWARVERTRQLAYGAARSADGGDPQAIIGLLVAKAEVAGTAVSVVNDAMSLAGGRAYRDRSTLTRLLRDARAADVMSPTTDLLYTWAGRAALGLPLLGGD